MPDDAAASRARVEDVAPPGVAGVLLAAGASSRFGANKLLLEFGGEPLVRRAASAALAAGLDPVVCVLGYEADRVLAALSGLPIRAVVNPDYARGMNSSLATGIAAVPAEAAAAVVQLADMPRVTADMLASLVAVFRETGAPLIASCYVEGGADAGDGIHAPPTLYARALFPELGGPEGDGCGKRVVRRHADAVVRVKWPAAALADVDRAEDWERMCVATS